MMDFYFFLIYPLFLVSIPPSVDQQVAAEIHFSQYPYSLYMQRDEHALTHLSSLTEKFSSSPLAIFSHYLLGINCLRQNDPAIREKALSYFLSAETTFQSLLASGGLNDQERDYYGPIAWEATLERGLATLPTDPISAIAIFEACEKRASTSNEIAKTQFYRAKALLLAGRKNEAKTLLDNLSATLDQNDPFAARATLVQGEIACQERDYQTALALFSDVEERNPSLTTEENLRLWIGQSTCYRHLGEKSLAMHRLSQVINAPTVSPLRIEAMYLRAEIYAEQGRYELAKRQLAAVKEKGGKWAEKADEKWKAFLSSKKKHKKRGKKR